MMNLLVIKMPFEEEQKGFKRMEQHGAVIISAFGLPVAGGYLESFDF